MTTNIKNNEIRNMNHEDLAVRLDQFAYDYDPYEYIDSFGTREEGLMQAVNAFLDGDLSGVKEFLTEIAKAEETEPEDRLIAERLLHDIEDFNQNVFPYEDSPNSVLNEIDRLKKDMSCMPQKRREEIL